MRNGQCSRVVVVDAAAVDGFVRVSLSVDAHETCSLVPLADATSEVVRLAPQFVFIGWRLGMTAARDVYTNLRLAEGDVPVVVIGPGSAAVRG